MMLDFTSLLISVGFSAAFLSAVLIAAWRTSRADGFLRTCAAGALLIAIGVGFSAIYIRGSASLFLTFAFAFMLAGLAALYGTAIQFRFGKSPFRPILIAGLVTLTATLPLIGIGYTGIAFIVGYFASAALLAMTSYQFWRARDEAPGTLMGIAGLYLLVALSFVPRALLVLIEGKAVIAGQPSNWAEDLSLVLVIAAIPGIGAMTMALSQMRLIRMHKEDAQTDPLTGLMNRRALFGAFKGALKDPVIVALFDIDHFKAINDAHGHAMGDRIIVLFANVLRDSLGAGHSAVRLGGEEFAIICPNSTIDAATRHADIIREGFSARVREEAGLHCTVSAGLSSGDAGTASIDRVLAEADQVLYDAKRAGRDRIGIFSHHSQRLSASRIWHDS
jgi:diguanylate cyclase (GGDEF)-like protein